MTPMTKLQATERSQRITEYLDGILPNSPLNLHQAMRYSVLNGGKRFRPQLLYAAGTGFGAQLDDLDSAAAAIELIHCYSLVHDDLPAMDNDDLRRGMPSCHIKFGQAMAILAGDALLTQAFEELTSSHLNDSIQIKLIDTLSQAAKAMVYGQALDINSQHQPLTIDELHQIHQAKTGQLIQAALVMGAQIAQCPVQHCQQLKALGLKLGLAFQIKDDLLDNTAPSLKPKPQSTAGLSYTGLQTPSHPGYATVKQSSQILNNIIDECLSLLKTLPLQHTKLQELILNSAQRQH